MMWWLYSVGAKKKITVTRPPDTPMDTPFFPLGKNMATTAVSFGILLLVVVCWSKPTIGDNVYVLDDTPGLGRVFDGIGGLSGGGVKP